MKQDVQTARRNLKSPNIKTRKRALKLSSNINASNPITHLINRKQIVAYYFNISLFILIFIHTYTLYLSLFLKHLH